MDNRKTILVVDDQPAIVTFVSSLLVSNEFDVITASSGKEAMEVSRSRKDKIDLLLSDFQMPGMSGVELATQMCRDRPGLKVLLMSGFPDGMLVLNEGWHFLAKPFIPSQLCALITGLTTKPIPPPRQ